MSDEYVAYGSSGDKMPLEDMEPCAKCTSNEDSEGVAKTQVTGYYSPPRYDEHRIEVKHWCKKSPLSHFEKFCRSHSICEDDDTELRGFLTVEDAIRAWNRLQRTTTKKLKYKGWRHK